MSGGALAEQGWAYLLGAYRRRRPAHLEKYDGDGDGDRGAVGRSGVPGALV